MSLDRSIYPCSHNPEWNTQLFHYLEKSPLPFQLSCIPPCRGNCLLISSTKDPSARSRTSHRCPQALYSVWYQAAFIQINIFEISSILLHVWVTHSFIVNSFLLWDYTMRLYHNLFIQPSLHEHMGYFQFEMFWSFLHRSFCGQIFSFFPR